jgi:hypothetical protein
MATMIEQTAKAPFEVIGRKGGLAAPVAQTIEAQILSGSLRVGTSPAIQADLIQKQQYATAAE